MVNPGIARIGRPANAAENGLQLVLEQPEVLERVARNLFGADHGFVGKALALAWTQLSQEGRERQIAYAIERVRAHTANYQTAADPDDDPDPGASWPALQHIA